MKRQTSWLGKSFMAKSFILTTALLFVINPLSPALAQEASTEQRPEVQSNESVNSDKVVAPEAADNEPSTVKEEGKTEVTQVEDDGKKEKIKDDKEKKDEGDSSEKDPEAKSLMAPAQQENDAKFREIRRQALPESDGVSGSLGHTLPIVIPPGRNGLQPDLSLSYSSQSSEEANVFAYGWSISIPYIERLNRKGSEKIYTEDYFNSSMAGELTSIGGGSYSSRVENGDFLSFSLTSNGWTVKDKRGTVYKFGTNAAERQDDPNNSSHIYKWMLQEVRDTNDNYIKYEYYKDGGQIYPYKIIYTGNGFTDGLFEIEFSRESRTDVNTSYKTAFLVTTNYRINEILTKVNGTWARKYVLAYTTADNGRRSVLNTIIESGQDDNANVITLAPTDFDYQTTSSGSGNGFKTDPNTTWSLPADLRESIVADVNGDGLPDVMRSWNNVIDYKTTYLNNGDGTFTSNANYQAPVIFYEGSNPWKEKGVRAVDVNGDGLVDLVQATNSVQYSWINNGNGWTSDNTWAPFMPLTDGNGGTCIECDATQMIDLNGDGLTDQVKAYRDGQNNVQSTVRLNNGNGYAGASAVWAVPDDLRQSIFIDLNGDSLPDVMRSWRSSGITYKTTYINKGDGTWVTNSNYEAPTLFFDEYTKDQGVRPVDLNGDGLLDLLQGNNSSGNAWINTGNGWNLSSVWWAPSQFVDGNGGTCLECSATTIFDIGGDGLSDVVRAYVQNGTQYSFVYHNVKKKVDLMVKVAYPTGGTTDIVYKTTPSYINGSTRLNPNLPFVLDTVASITNTGGGVSSTINYSYEGGSFYFSSPYDRKFAGFNKITKTDSAGNVTKTFYHQGNGTDSSNGEYSDHYSKIGKVYRTEVSNGSGAIYAKSINKWDKYNLGAERDFVKFAQKIDFTYDGDSTHKDKAESYTYNDSNGNLTQKVQWGEVVGANAGTFSDTGADKYTVDFSYASNVDANILALPSQEVVIDQNTVKVQETKHYYDLQTLGSVNDGNETKTEQWKSGSDYVDIERTYNTTYGIITQEKDARDKAVNYSYDAYNLYPATITNSLSQTTSYSYDYSSGKVKQITNPNTRVIQNVLDGLDRIIEEKQPDITSPGTLVTKASYVYTDTANAFAVKKSDYLDGSIVADLYTYYDGLGRKIQERREAEGTDFSVKDYIYNNLGFIDKESLPYFSSGSSKTAATSDSNMLTTYSYDPLYRAVSVVNSIGTISTSNDDWKQTVTDARGKTKDLYKDAYDNLIRVDEHNGGSTYTTTYNYNYLGNLTKITDALSNVRNFTYDGLGRRLSAEDLHAGGDNTYGTWSYTYDDAGNLTQTLNPNNQTVNYTYDDINRVLTENYTGQAGTEVAYTYDSGTDGIGHLTSVVNSSSGATYSYNPLGYLKQEIKTLNSTNYQTDYTTDRQGNQLTITSPDSSIVKYNYNSAGQLESVQRKESTDGSYINIVSNFDYGPHGKVTTQTNANGTTETYIYDITKQYRLSRKKVTTAASEPTPVTVNIYAGSGDGYIRNINDNWDLAHDATDGAEALDWNYYMYAGSDSPGNYHIWRMFLPFNTASLPDDAVITNANLKVWVYTPMNDDNDGDDFVSVVQTSQASTSGVSEADFDQAGLVNNPTEGINSTDRKDLSSISSSQYLSFPLNATGKSWISTTGYTKLGLREGHDILDHPVSGASPIYSRLIVRTSDYEGTQNDPYLEITYTSGGGGALQDLSYTYDANNNITQIVDASNTSASKTVSYTYDDLNRLTNATATNVATGQSTYNKSYTYDAIGNITAGDEGNYTYAGTGYANPHAVTLVSSPSTTFTYDNNGNLTGDGTWTNTWDYSNRLTQSAKTGTTVTYAYDHTGQRVKQDNGTTATYYPSKYYNTDGTTPIKHILTPDGQTIATVKGTGASAFVFSVHTDHLSGSNVVTNGGGALEELMDYFPYGNIRIDQKAGTFDEQRKFTGLEYDVDTGLNYAGARYYNAAIGRFISQDPAFWTIGKGLPDPQLMNSYAYARNNPMVYTDPDGQWPTLAQANAFLAKGDRYNPLNILFGADTNRLSNAIATGNGKEAAKAGGNIALTTGAVIVTAFDIANIAADAATTYRAYNRYQQYQQELQAIEERTAARSAEIQAQTQGKIYGRFGNYIPQVGRNNLAPNIRSSLEAYEDNGWKPIQGLQSHVYENREGYLPSSERYTQFDINPKTSATRDAQRFYVGDSSGSVYYTDTHMNGNKGVIVNKIK